MKLLITNFSSCASLLGRNSFTPTFTKDTTTVLYTAGMAGQVIILRMVWRLGTQLIPGRSPSSSVPQKVKFPAFSKPKAHQRVHYKDPYPKPNRSNAHPPTPFQYYLPICTSPSLFADKNCVRREREF
jgi:hypothetical protein